VKDSVTYATDWVSSALTAFSISPWAFVVLIGLVVIGLIGRELVKNTKITELIAGKVTVIDVIRADQIKSNEERKAQAEVISNLDHRVETLHDRVTKVELVLNTLSCTKCEE